MRLREEKGFNREIQVIVAHPSPYVDLYLADYLPSVLHPIVGRKTHIPFAGSDVLGVSETHRAQISMVRDFIKTLSADDDLKGVPLFVAGDLNINKYATMPDSKEENDPRSASRGRSREFTETLRKLNAAVPTFVPDMNTKRWVPKDRLESAIVLEDFLARFRTTESRLTERTETTHRSARK